jgi:hypothetical protein
VRSFEQQAEEAEKILREEFALPDASVFNFKPALEQARRIINQQKYALAGKAALEKRQERLEADLREERQKNERMEAASIAEKKQHADAMKTMQTQHDKLRVELEEVGKFMREPEVQRLHDEYARREEVARLLADQKAREQRERDEAQRSEPEPGQRPRMRLR